MTWTPQSPNGANDNAITALASLAPDTQNTGAKIPNNIQAFNDNGNKIVKVQSSMQLTGEILRSGLAKIQTGFEMIHMDETLTPGSGYSN
jgi:hypothetical protein